MRIVSPIEVELTDLGRENARSLVRSHRLWEAFLVEYFDLPLDHLHAPAERVEHYIGPQLQEKLAAAVHAPAVDPARPRDSTFDTSDPGMTNVECPMSKEIRIPTIKLPPNVCYLVDSSFGHSSFFRH